MIEIKKYNHELQQQWDCFVLAAKNGHFMFCRDYMDYHSDRFHDFSLLFYSDNELIAVMPANIDGSILHSHQGLSFGGLIMSKEVKTPLIKTVFDTLLQFLKNQEITKLIYKQIPHIYYSLPSQEDTYFLFNLGATLSRVDLTSTIYYESKIPFSSRRKRGIKTALKNNIRIEKTNNYQSYHKVLSDVLEHTHGTKPTHTLAEMELLASKFPNNISLYVALDNEGNTLAGVQIFEMNHWSHAQYIASSIKGKEVGALDLLFNELIDNIYKDKKVFDFGISTEQGGTILNTGLVTQKEEFGARSCNHNFYELQLS